MSPRQADTTLAMTRLLKRHLEALRFWGIDALPVSAAPARSPDSSSTATKTAALAKVEQEVIICQRCPLYRSRTHHVFSDGNPDAQLVFVGEAPGREEDLQGKPFVGAAGQLLTKMIEAIGLKRSEVYICNVLKDRPPGNRTPEPDEIDACLPFLERQLAIIEPKVICALGAVAAKALLGSQVAITKVRGTVHAYRGIPLVPTFHPAYLLRNPPAKRLVWQDLKTVKAILQQSAISNQ